MAKHIGKPEMVLGTGAGVGMIQAYLTRDVLDSMWGPIPYISDYLGTWGTYSVFGNIAIGAVAFGLSTFTKMFNRNITARAFLQGYGFTALLGGIFNGIFPNLQLKARLGSGQFSTHNVITNPNYRAAPAMVARRMDTNSWQSYLPPSGIGGMHMPNSSETPLLF